MKLRKIAAASALGLSMGLALLGTGTVASAHSAWLPSVNTAQDNIIIANDSFNRRFGGFGCGFDGFGGCGGFGGFGGFGGGWGGGWGGFC
jgi:hypothetical protein